MKWPLFIALLLAAAATWADLPLEVEDLLTARHRYRVDLGVEYRNREYSDLSSGYVGSLDTSVLSLGLRYGFTLRTEWFLRAYGYHAEQRTQSFTGIERDSDTDWSRLAAGLNHQFSPDATTPALLGFLALDVVDNEAAGDGVGHLTGASGGLTTYRSLDPLLISAVLRYDHRDDRSLASTRLDPGDSIVFSPRLSFAVNHLVTLTGGFEWERREQVRWDGRDLGVDRTRTSLLMGLGYSWNEDISVSFNGRFSVTDSEGSSLSVALVYRFDDSAYIARDVQRRGSNGT